MPEHQHHTCRDCTGRGGELVIFNVTFGGEPYEPGATYCPICGQSDTVETVEEYKARHN